MATNISVRVSRNPYGMPGSRFEVSFAWDGVLNRYQFDDRFQLADMLVDDSTERSVVDEVMDSLDGVEWGELPVYPLGVSYVGDSVTSRTPDSAPRTSEYPVKQAFFTDVETDRHRELIEELRRTNDRLWFRSEGFKVMLGVSFAVIALLIWRPWA